MERFRFQFSNGGGLAAEAIESDHSSLDDAMCDAARTVAEMLKEQAQAGRGLSGFSITVHDDGGAEVGRIAIAITGVTDVR